MRQVPRNCTWKVCSLNVGWKVNIKSIIKVARHTFFGHVLFSVATFDVRAFWLNLWNVLFYLHFILTYVRSVTLSLKRFKPTVCLRAFTLEVPVSDVTIQSLSYNEGKMHAIKNIVIRLWSYHVCCDNRKSMLLGVYGKTTLTICLLSRNCRERHIRNIVAWLHTYAWNGVRTAIAAF